MIQLKNITLRRGTHTILEQACLTLNPGEKVGLVGPNGAGKTSLFKLLDGTLSEDTGERQLPSHWQIAQVEQHQEITQQTAIEYVIDGDSVLKNAREKWEQVLAENNEEELASACQALYDAGEQTANTRAATLINGLGFSTPELTKAVNEFSGGWRVRLQLARALMCPSDLLLLDEPTNHLDLPAVFWLEQWLQNYSGTLVIISHDREFLDNVTQITVHVSDQKLHRYGLNFSDSCIQRALQQTQQQKAFAQQQKKMGEMQEFINRFKAKASKSKQAQSRVKALERMEQITPTHIQNGSSITFLAPQSIPNPLLTLSQARLGYTDPEQIIFPEVSITLLAEQRIGILGANGQGKSTLIKTLVGDLAVLNGTVTYGRELSIGYFAQQEMDILKAHWSPFDHLLNLRQQDIQKKIQRNYSEQDLKSHLGKFQFGNDKMHQPVQTLSGGERARLILALIIWQRPNLLILDEPTNHLDIDTREALAWGLQEFQGSVILVSHDRTLLKSVCDEFWLVNQGTLQPFTGDLEDYQRFLLKPPSLSSKKNSSFGKQKRLRLPDIEQQLKKLLEQEQVHPSPELTEQIRVLEARWLELSLLETS